jgi:hypothetical protein
MGRNLIVCHIQYTTGVGYDDKLRRVLNKGHGDVNGSTSEYCLSRPRYKTAIPATVFLQELDAYSQNAVVVGLCGGD